MAEFNVSDVLSNNLQFLDCKVNFVKFLSVHYQKRIVNVS